MSLDYRKYLDVAEIAAKRAGALLLEAYGRVAVREKGPADLVTEADFASQKLIAEIILEAFPDHTLLGEEEGLTLVGDNPWRWIVDPLDGTINYAHGNPLWCVSIALEHAGELVVGVVHHPILGATYGAASGLGAALNGRPIRVSREERLSTCLISTGMPTDFATDANRQLALMGRFSSGTHSVRRTGTSAWNLATVAAGGFDVCYATSMNPWDAAAGVVLVREAGGAVTSLAGRQYDLYRTGILATNGLVHDEAVRAAVDAWPDVS